MAEKKVKAETTKKAPAKKSVEVKAPKVAKAPAKVKKVASGATITVKQVASGAGRLKNQIQTLKGLGLNKINKISVLEDTPSIRGMVKTVQHLVQVIQN